MRNNIWDAELTRPNPFHTLSSLASLSSLSGYLPGFFQGRWQGRKISSSLKLTQWTPFFERVKYCYRNVKYAYRRVSGRGCKVPFDTLYMLFYCNSTLFYIILNLSACPDVKRGRLATYPDLTIYVRGRRWPQWWHGLCSLHAAHLSLDFSGCSWQPWNSLWSSKKGSNRSGQG